MSMKRVEYVSLVLPARRWDKMGLIVYFFTFKKKKSKDKFEEAKR